MRALLALVVVVAPLTTMAASLKYVDFVVRAKAAVTDRMKDPESVRWKGLFISGGGRYSLCGEVNARNAAGGYVGFHRFYVTDDLTYVEIEQERDSGGFDAEWRNECMTPIEMVR